MIIKNDKGFQTNSIYPNSDWTGEADYVVEDGTELAEKIIRLYPNYDFVLKNGEIVDVVEIPPVIVELTEEEKKVKYEELTMKYIHEKYTYDDENKIMREYISDRENEEYKRAFENYNSYVITCKAKAKEEVYGK